MQRITISLDDQLADALDEYLRNRSYQSRSEGLRDLVREAMNKPGDQSIRHAHCVATFSYIYNHRVRALASRLSDLQHAHHNVIASTTLMHLDHEDSLESVILKGPTTAVLDLANRIAAERGVRSALINLVGVHPHDHHGHVHDHDHSGHAHMSPVH
jgi:CopG family transcriptional regulator, nickel-responsive regulator